MALANYTDLQAAVVSWHKRDAGMVPDAITLAEKRINNLLESRLAETESTLTATIDNRYIALPTGYYRNLGLWLTTYGNRTAMIFVSPESLPVLDYVTGQPSYYTIDGSNIAFEYPCDVAHAFVFRYKKGYNLASTTTNHILTNHPAVYLYGALREVNIFSVDPEKAQGYEELFQQALKECIRTEFASKTQATLTIEPALVGAGRTNILAGDM